MPTQKGRLRAAVIAPSLPETGETMPALPITSLVAALTALGLVALSVFVSLRRIKVQVQTGHGGDDALRRRARAQGNFTEYAPMLILLLALNEAGGAMPGLLWTMAGMFGLGRLLHVSGMLSNRLPLVSSGTVLNHASLITGAVGLLRAAF